MLSVLKKLGVVFLLLGCALPLSLSTRAAAPSFGSGLDVCPAPQPVVLSNPTTVTECTQEGLQTALDSGGQIDFDCGTQPVTITVSSTLVINPAVDTVLDGGGLVTLDGQGTTRIMSKGWHDPNLGAINVTLQNLRFVNGKAPAADKTSGHSGGAVLSGHPGTRLHIINCTFEDNSTTEIHTADNQGGAIFSHNSYETVIAGSLFKNNEAGNGGAFGGIATGLIVVNSRFEGNGAVDDSEGGIVKGHGGAIHLDGVTNSYNPSSNRRVYVCGSEFVDNTAVRGGGALKVTVSDNQGTRAIYRDSSFINNRLVSVPPAEGHGGAIYHIEDDYAAAGGNEYNFEVSGSTFADNYAYKQGGAVWVSVHGRGRIANSTFTGNEASVAGTNRVGQGGALVVNKGLLDIVNSTFASNFATFQGGAIFAGGASSEKVITLANSIFYRNDLDETHTNPVTTEWQGYHTNRSLENGGGNLQYPRTKEPDFDNEVNNLITSPTSAILFADPLLNALADNGGHNQTMALQPGSPAIDAGNESACTALDQRDYTRVGTCDIGAYEYGGAPFTPTDFVYLPLVLR